MLRDTCDLRSDKILAAFYRLMVLSDNLPNQVVEKLPRYDWFVVGELRMNFSQLRKACVA